MSIDLTGRICLITGARQGIGAAVAEGFTRRGATVIATDLEAPSLPVAYNCAWDVTSHTRANEVVADVLERYGRLDVLVANAGTYPRQDWSAITEEDWRTVVGINLDGAWRACQAAARPMVEQGYGKIVTVSSIEVNLGVAMHNHYDAAKAGIHGLTRSLARSLGANGVRVNCLMPGAVMTETEMSQFPDLDKTAKICDEHQCLPGRVLPEHIEPAFAFLCSAESDVITGQVLCADAGWIHY